LSNSKDEINNNNNINKNDDEQISHHVVDGIKCVDMTIQLSPIIGPVTILEATASSQDDLVNMAITLFDEDEDDDDKTKINKLEKGDPYGAVLWPAASALANYLVEDFSSDDEQKKHKRDTTLLNGLTILELGAGTGLISLACALCGASKVIATDYETVPLKLLQYAAKNLNSKNNLHFNNNIINVIETSHLDLCDESQPLPLDNVDIVVAGDVMYEPKTGIALAKRVHEAFVSSSSSKNNNNTYNGIRVIIADSPGRPGRPAFLEELKTLGLGKYKFEKTWGYKCQGHRHDLICGKGSTSVAENKNNREEVELLEVAIMDLKPAAAENKEN